MISLRNQLLVAMPMLDEPYFAKSVILICDHNPQGAMGLIINQPSSLPLDQLLAQMGIETDYDASESRPVMTGGPVQPERGFVIHRPVGQWEASLPLSDDFSITTSRDILVELPYNPQLSQALVALGYAGWSESQLEQELASNSWLCVPATHELVFNTPFEQRWQAAAASIGIDIHAISWQVGHG